jgi:hypothetical protein
MTTTCIRRWWAIAGYVNSNSNRRLVAGLTVTNSNHIAHLSNILCVAEADLLFAGDQRILQLFLLKFLLSLSSTCFASLCFDVLEKLGAGMKRGNDGADRSNDLSILSICLFRCTRKTERLA